MNDEIFLNERVEVIARFGEGLDICRPIRFRRPNGREVAVVNWAFGIRKAMG